MSREELEKYPIVYILEILTNLGNKLGDNDLIVQCNFYLNRKFSDDIDNNIFYSWVEIVMERNNIEFIKRIRSIKLKKLNQL